MSSNVAVTLYVPLPAHAASVAGLKDTLGIPAPTCSLKDLIGTDLVVILGSHLANNQPVSITASAIRGLFLGPHYQTFISTETTTTLVLKSMAWAAGIVLVFAPLAVRRYRKAV